MLSTDSRKILKFLKKHRPNEYSKPEIIDSVHIEHADKIIEQLRIDDYLQLYMDTRDDKVVAVYTISDIGMAALQERRELMFARLITRTLSIAAIIISILALLSQLGILRLPQY